MSTDDATDGRVLIPDGEEVFISSSCNSTSNRYHTERCETVRSMVSPRTVQLSVAEWKGLDQCERCQRRKNGVDEDVVSELRRRVLDENSAVPVADEFDLHPATLRRHVKGERNYTGEPAHPPLTWDPSEGWSIDG